MPTHDSGQTRPQRTHEDEVEESPRRVPTSPSTRNSTEKTWTTSTIDEVLESNAEDFVRKPKKRGRRFLDHMFDLQNVFVTESKFCPDCRDDLPLPPHQERANEGRLGVHYTPCRRAREIASKRATAQQEARYPPAHVPDGKAIVQMSGIQPIAADFPVAASSGRAATLQPGIVRENRTQAGAQYHFAGDTNRRTTLIGCR